MKNLNYDIIIAGAGPAGSISAYLLSGLGLKIALVEKSTFPRDKICGDGLSGDVIKQLYRIDSDLAGRFTEIAEKNSSIPFGSLPQITII